ncbi:MAG: hypothetical protein ALAOOOJD_00533 [bacterium]|nr:hypothetical protein [bacterium]
MQINLGAIDRFFDRIDRSENVTGIVIQTSQTFGHRLLQFRRAVSVAGLKAQQRRQQLIGKKLVAFPRNLADVIFIAFVHPQIDEHIFFIHPVIKRVPDQLGVTIPFGTIKLHDFFQVFPIFLFVKIAAAQPGILLRLLHLLAQLAVGKRLIAMKGNGFDLHLVAFVDFNLQIHASGIGGGFRVGFDRGQQIALFLISLVQLAANFSQLAGADHLTFVEIDVLLEIFFLEFFIAFIFNFIEARRFGDFEGEINAIPHLSIQHDLHIFKHIQLPQLLDGRLNIVARYLLANREAGA